MADAEPGAHYIPPHERKGQTDKSLVASPQLTNITIRRSNATDKPIQALDLDISNVEEEPPQPTIMDMFTSLNAKMTEQIDRLKRMDVSAVNTNKSLQFAHDSLKDLKSKVEMLGNENIMLRKQADQYQRHTRDMGRRLDNIEQRLEQNDHAQRRKNILIEGVAESEGENAVDIAVDIVSNILPNFSRNDLEFAQRITKPGGKRPILVIFRSVYGRDEVLRKKRDLKQTNNLRSVWINEDANPTIRKQKSECRAVVREAQKQGLAASQKGTGIIVNNIYYPHSKLNNLPEDIKLAHTRTRVSDTAVGFAGPLAVLSNMYEAPYVIDGKEHKTVEHGHFYTKAVLANDQKAAQAIRDTDCPRVAKSIGKSVHAPGWNGIELTNLKKHMKEKYLQNEHCMKELLSTGTKKILELTWDRKWAAGYGPYSKLFLTGAQPGQNLTGYTLEELRTEFKAQLVALGGSPAGQMQSVADTGNRVKRNAQRQGPADTELKTRDGTSPIPEEARPTTAGNLTPALRERLVRTSPATEV